MKKAPERVRLIPTAYWADDALCIGEPYELFFGSDEFPMTAPNSQLGRKLCSECPVRRDCLLDSLLSGERTGMRGGFLGHERRHTMRRRKNDVSLAMLDFDRGVFYQTKGTR